MESGRSTGLQMPRQYWTVRLGGADNTEDFLRLWRDVYGYRDPVTHRSEWEWRYLSNADFPTDLVMAEYEGRPVAIRPMTLFDFQWKTRRLKGAMHWGLLTHPEHRRRGIFRSLVAYSNELVARRGAQFSITMPNDRSLKGFFRFGDWISPGLIPLYLKVVDGPAVLRPKIGRLPAYMISWPPQLFFRRRCGPRCLGRFSCRSAVIMPEEFDEVFDEFAHDCGQLLIRRTAAYWNWRYGAKPVAEYRTLILRQGGRMVGAVVTSVGRRIGLDVGMVIDLVARGGVRTLRQLLREAEAELQSRGLGLVACQATSSMLQRALQEEGYRRPNPKWLPKKFNFLYRPTEVPGLPRQPSQLTDWHLTFGDSDNV